MDKDLIIILIAVGASIISAIVKHKNKKKQKHATAPTFAGKPQRPKDPMGKIRKMIEQFEKAGQEGGGEVVAVEREFSPSPFDYDPSIQVITAPEEVIDESMAKRIETAKLRESKIRDIDVSIEIKGEHEHEPVISNILKDFDLRKAVIYSEILKPKF